MKKGEDAIAVKSSAGVHSDREHPLHDLVDRGRHLPVRPLAESVQRQQMEMNAEIDESGLIVCLGGYGTVPIINTNLGPAQVTFKAADIATMLGTDGKLTTIATTVAGISQASVLNIVEHPSKDSEGHTVAAFAGQGDFGISAAQ